MKKLLFLFLITLSNLSYSQRDTNILELQEVNIQGIRADEKTPVSQKTIKGEEIDKMYHSQELPLLLNNTPNINSSTDGISVENETGLNENKTALYTRFSTFGTDGYKYNSGSQGYSFFMSGGYYGDKDVFKVTTFSGRSFNQNEHFALQNLVLT